ncbi:MAG: sugar ABC transporter permease [Oscillospiraceae bacterium]|nr:sugar ABC transporter permease [Oscillospiraceae bacterium]
MAATKSIKKTEQQKQGAGKKGGSLMSFRKQQLFTIIVFLAIPTALLLLFTYVPLVQMVRWSFTDWRGYTEMNFVGLKNYIRIFTRKEFWDVFKVSIYYFIGSLVQIAVALYFATIFFYKLAGKNFFKGVLFFPSLLNGVAIAFIFQYFFKQGGTLDTVVSWFGVPQESIPLWIGNTAIINISLTFISVWRYMGQNMVLFAGATQSVGMDYFEAAALDGANKWQQFRYLILPSIRDVVLLNVILSVKGAISVYETPYIMTMGSGGSETFVIKALNTAFTQNQIGLACAMGVVLLIITMIVTFVQQAVFAEKED